MKRFKKFFYILVITLTLPLTVYLVGTKTSFFQRAYYNFSGQKANLVIDLASSKTFTPPWRYFAQGGEGKEESLVPVISRMQKLAPAYIRIDHIYDFYDVVSRDANGNLVFNWDKLDIQIRAIQATGARPFISLSYFPPILTGKSEVDLPKSWDEWAQVVRRTVEHISGVNALAIAGVYYEVWNEPDLFGGFKLAGEKNYLTLYEYAERGAGDADNTMPFKFGGPSITSLNRSWFDPFFNFAQSKALRVDFYSWHLYSKDISRISNDLNDVKIWISRYPRYANTQFIITESGFDSDNNPGYDNSFGAIHAFATFAETFPGNPMIFVFEVKDGLGNTKYWGRWGILTNEKFGEPTEKPRYKAIEFLNNLGDRYFSVSGQGTWVKAIATQDSETKVVKVLIVNYDQYGAHSEKVPIEFSNLPFGNFSLRKTDFLGNSTDTAVSASGLSWKTDISLKPNSAVILELAPR